MMSNMLRDMFLMKKQFQRELSGVELPKDSVQDYQYTMLAIVSELGEILSADKRWKNLRSNHLDKENKIEEIVDVLHFVINLALFSGYDYEDIYRVFEIKHEINLERLRKERTNVNNTGGCQ